MKYDVITFGSGVVDVFVDTDVSEKRGFMSYEVGSKILLKGVRFDVGGGGTNTAVAFSRLGLKVGWIGGVGGDNNGFEILDLIKKEKVAFLGEIDEDGLSGYSVILDSKENNRTILTFKGVNDGVSIGDLNLRKVRRTKWLYHTSLLGRSFETQKRLARELVGRGVKLALNPSEYSVKRQDLRGLLKLCEVLILNKEEGELLLKREKVREKDLLKGLVSLGPKVVVVTDKNKVIRACDNRGGDGRRYSLKPNKVKVVERTGAGDAFASGFVAGLIVGKSVEESLKLGLRESESVIKYFGAKNKLIKMRLK